MPPTVPASDLERSLGRLSDAALLQLLDGVIAFARARSLAPELRQILGDNLREMLLEAEACASKAGRPSMFDALPSVREAEAGAP